jgi:rhodanese-related sulfurtransferase
MLTQFVVHNWYLFAALVVVVALLAYDPIRTRLLNIQKISPLDLPRLMSREGAVVVDVCEPHEYNEGHVAGAVNIPLSRLAGDLERIKKYRKKPVVLCCRSGNRSIRGAAVLRRNGFETVYNLAGGITAWEKEHLPMEK